MGRDKRQLLQRSQGYGLKLVLITMVLIIFIPPIEMVRNLIRERSQRSREAVEEVVGSWGGRLQLTSPMLVIPYHYFINTKDEHNNTVRNRIEQTLIIFPTETELILNAPVEMRNRGIYSIPVYNASVQVSGTFDVADVNDLVPQKAVVEFDKAHVGLAMSSLKGVSSISPLQWDREAGIFEPCVLPLDIYEGEISAPVKLSDANESYAFSFHLDVRGGGQMEHIPLARSTIIRMSSNWSAPSFYGEFLPTERSLSEEGFSARWDISYLSRNLPGHTIAGAIEQYRFVQTGFGVRFIEPVSIYSLNERSIKYAWLFLLIPFITLFLFEILQDIRIHPVQYLLAGAADIVFYLLLLSASEHIRFGTAYLIAASSVTVLLALYSSQILQKKSNGGLMALILGVGYLYLYVVLQSEDYALLYGSAGLFIILALVMFVTRKVKWYRQPDTIEKNTIVH